MTRQTKTQKIQELEDRIRALEQENERLSIDPGYGILNRQALEISPIPDGVSFVAFLDVDYLHDFNSKHGHDEANRRIRQALHVRSSDVILSGRWYSGDEIVILLSGDPEAFSARLREAFEREEMSITIAAVPYSGDLLGDVERAKEIVFRSKAERGVKR